MKKITSINTAISQAISNISVKATKPMQEPDYCAAMVLELPRLLNVSPAFPKIRFAGCFIHQSPKVTFCGKSAKPSTCELGDLLVICHDKVDGDDRYNAALIQLKKPTNGCTETIKGDALKQLYLYEHWPKFTLNSTGTVVYDIYPKTVTPGAQYGIICSGVQDKVFCSIPSILLSAQDSVSFARFLINLMKWQTGRPFVLDLKNTDDTWSFLISQLIHVSLSKRFNRKNIGQFNQPRMSKRLFSFFSSFEEKDGVAKDKEDGISILYIEMEEEQ